jgi:hypothetical protein
MNNIVEVSEIPLRYYFQDHVVVRPLVLLSIFFQFEIQEPLILLIALSTVNHHTMPE